MDIENAFDEKGKAAEKIVNDYGTSLGVESTGFARPISLLKNSKEEIKVAIKEYIKILISTERLSKEITQVLSFGYASIELFTEDEKAAQINELERQSKAGNISDSDYFILNDHVQKTTSAMKENIADITDFLKAEVEKR